MISVFTAQKLVSTPFGGKVLFEGSWEKDGSCVSHIEHCPCCPINLCHPLKARTRKNCLQQPDLLWLKSEMILLVRYSSFSCLSLSLCQPVSQPQNVYTTLTASFHKSIQDDKCKDNWIYGFIRLIGNIEYIFCFSKKAEKLPEPWPVLTIWLWMQTVFRHYWELSDKNGNISHKHNIHYS